MEGSRGKKKQMKLTFRAGLKGWMHHVVNGYSSQTPFHYSRNEYGHGTVASRLTHACVYSCVHVSCVSCAFVHECDISVLAMWWSWVVCIVCSGGWAPPLWRLPAAEGLERWHCWNGADLFVNVSVFVSFSVCISCESYESCVCHKSERELDQIKGNPGTGLTPIPTREGKNDRIWKLQFKGKEHHWCLDERREEWDEL